VVDWSKIQQPSSSRFLTTLDVSKTARAILNGYVKEAQTRNIAISTDKPAATSTVHSWDEVVHPVVHET